MEGVNENNIVENVEQSSASARFEAEQKRLASTNLPGRQETWSIGEKRLRQPSISAARSTYREILGRLKLQILELFEPDVNQGGLPVARKHAKEAFSVATSLGEELQNAAEKLIRALSAEGACMESTEVDNEVKALQSQLMTFRQDKAQDLLSERSVLARSRGRSS